MTRRRRAVASRGPKNNIWSVILIENLVISTTTIEADIITAQDIQATTTGFQRYTLLRIRGWVSMAKAVTSTTHVSMFMCIYVTDADAGVIDPTSANAYVDEDILWTGGALFEASGAGAVEPAQPLQFNIDVKAMRKIDTGRDVRFAVVATNAGNVRMSATLRALTRKGGN